MPYTIDWYLENEILLMTYSGTMTIDDMIQANDHAKAYIAEIGRPIYLISILEEGTKVPTDIRFYVDITVVTEDNFKLNFAVGAPSFIVLISRIIARMTKVKILAVDSLEEALQIIAKREPDLIK